MTATYPPNRSEEVDRFLAKLDHPRVAEIEAIRATILGCDPGITERIKWNAPSFCHSGEDRVTFRLVFHRGARKRSTDGFGFDDPTGWLSWAALDRATLTFAGMDDVETRRDALADLTRAWVASVDGTDG